MRIEKEKELKKISIRNWQIIRDGSLREKQISIIGYLAWKFIPHFVALNGNAFLPNSMLIKGSVNLFLEAPLIYRLRPVC